MNKAATHHVSIKSSALLTNKERLAIIQQTAGTWKRPLKETMRTLASIRRGFDRKIK